MDLLAEIAANLGMVVFTGVSFLLVAYLVFWMIHPEFG